jgi:hypothetical protein
VPWERERFMPGGRPALHWYEIHGEFAEPLHVQLKERHRARGVPAGIEARRVPGSEALRRWSRYQHDELERHPDSIASAVAAASGCVILRGETPDRPDLYDLRDVIGIVSALLDDGGVAVHDVQTLRWWSAREWVDRFSADDLAVANHVVTLISGDWLHTRGLRKFGRPDISIHGVSAGGRDSALALIQRTIDFQAHGGVIDPHREIVVHGHPEGMRFEAHLADGDLDDPDFNNMWVEVRGFR